MNFLLAAAINLVGMLVIFSLMANSLTRLYWHGRGTISVLVTIIAAGLFWIVPLVPNLRELDSPAGAFWFGNWLASSFSVIILCQSVRWIPRELEDAARLDGCGWFATYRRVVLPLVLRELGLIALLGVMTTVLVFWGTAPLGIVPPWLYLLLPMASEDNPGAIRILLMMMAGSVIMTLPVMLIFFLSKSWFPRPTKIANE